MLNIKGLCTGLFRQTHGIHLGHSIILGSLDMSRTRVIRPDISLIQFGNLLGDTSKPLCEQPGAHQLFGCIPSIFDTSMQLRFTVH